MVLKGAIGKTANAFIISRVPVLAIIIRVSHATTNFLGPQLIKLSTIENNVKKLTNFGTREFPQCRGAIDDIHIEIAELNKRYSDYINRNYYFSWKVQAVSG